VTDGLGLRAANVVTAGRAWCADEVIGAGFAGATRGIAIARLAIDRLLAVVLDRPTFAGTGLGPGVGLALPRLVALARVPPLAVLVALLAPLAPALGVGLVSIEQGEQSPKDREGGEQAEYPPTAARLAQRAGKRIKRVVIHFGSRR
jgi:hypothetical protein